MSRLGAGTLTFAGVDAGAAMADSGTAVVDDGAGSGAGIAHWAFCRPTTTGRGWLAHSVG